ncbi:MAG: SRPBCC domain-containing protein [Chloroflexi bacterium]|nr:SRPBCC domain-containing protein [Chloroflexota bacterium]
MPIHKVKGEEIIQCEVKINARPETIFPFFIDPVKMLKWKGIKANLDPQPGGTYKVEVTPKHVALGKYVEVTPNSRVVFTWGWEGDGHPVPPGSTTVEITLHPQGSATLVRLKHTGLVKATSGQHDEGWVHFLERLSIAAEGRDPGPDPWVSRDTM